MSTESAMVVITAFIRPNMEGRVIQALHELPDFPGVFITEARGQGRGRGVGGTYRPSDFDLTYHHFLQVQLVCREDASADVCNRIAAAARTGRRADGVIFTTEAQSFCRIRETGAGRAGPSQ